jgi:hypothetical protein
VPGLLLAQADRATIEGVVTDASGASIVAATLKMLRIETHDVIQLKTNESGRYFLANLPLVLRIHKITQQSVSGTARDSASASDTRQNLSATHGHQHLAGGPLFPRASGAR